MPYQWGPVRMTRPEEPSPAGEANLTHWRYLRRRRQQIEAMRREDETPAQRKRREREEGGMKVEDYTGLLEKGWTAEKLEQIEAYKRRQAEGVVWPSATETKREGARAIRERKRERETAMAEATSAIETGDEGLVREALGNPDIRYLGRGTVSVPGQPQKEAGLWQVDGRTLTSEQIRGSVLRSTEQRIGREMRLRGPSRDEALRKRLFAPGPRLPEAPRRPPRPPRIFKGELLGTVVSIDEHNVATVIEVPYTEEHFRQSQKIAKATGTKLTPWVKWVSSDGSVVQGKRNPETGEFDKESIAVLDKKKQEPIRRLESQDVTIYKDGKPTLVKRYTEFIRDPKTGKWKQEPIAELEMAQPDRTYTLQDKAGNYGIWHAGTGVIDPMPKGWKPRREVNKHRRYEFDTGEVDDDGYAIRKTVFAVQRPDGTILFDPKIGEAALQAIKTGEPQERAAPEAEAPPEPSPALPEGNGQSATSEVREQAAAYLEDAGLPVTVENVRGLLAKHGWTD